MTSVLSSAHLAAVSYSGPNNDLHRLFAGNHCALPDLEIPYLVKKNDIAVFSSAVFRNSNLSHADAFDAGYSRDGIFRCTGIYGFCHKVHDDFPSRPAAHLAGGGTSSPHLGRVCGLFPRSYRHPVTIPSSVKEVTFDQSHSRHSASAASPPGWRLKSGGAFVAIQPVLAPPRLRESQALGTAYPLPSPSTRSLRLVGMERCFSAPLGGQSEDGGGIFVPDVLMSPSLLLRSSRRIIVPCLTWTGYLRETSRHLRLCARLPLSWLNHKVNHIRRRAIAVARVEFIQEFTNPLQVFLSLALHVRLHV